MKSKRTSSYKSILVMLGMIVLTFIVLIFLDLDLALCYYSETTGLLASGIKILGAIGLILTYIGVNSWVFKIRPRDVKALPFAIFVISMLLVIGFTFELGCFG